ncbi:hypothetical protein NSK_007113 [Nannochloropsis salina CCMP1776]|uniref:Uncharacterized protein n=1 Tax=Nannochloropsis salina CCMP1776 TaxID=1027361 RepID=A0A4D9CSQ9_9STRA|nr:hypothetical protein NSK_007113 [Nannochloropsis salina CCMP1776]|eukprot:TFJ81866.1 hypothetical protein NSK_007113 [Nannochloropsis salina CCMP1776]
MCTNELMTGCVEAPTAMCSGSHFSAKAPVGGNELKDLRCDAQSICKPCFLTRDASVNTAASITDDDEDEDDESCACALERGGASMTRSLLEDDAATLFGLGGCLDLLANSKHRLGARQTSRRDCEAVEKESTTLPAWAPLPVPPPQLWRQRSAQEIRKHYAVKLGIRTMGTGHLAAGRKASQWRTSCLPEGVRPVIEKLKGQPESYGGFLRLMRRQTLVGKGQQAPAEKSAPTGNPSSPELRSSLSSADDRAPACAACHALPLDRAPKQRALPVPVPGRSSVDSTIEPRPAVDYVGGSGGDDESDGCGSFSSEASGYLSCSSCSRTSPSFPLPAFQYPLGTGVPHNIRDGRRVGGLKREPKLAVPQVSNSAGESGMGKALPSPSALPPSSFPSPSTSSFAVRCLMDAANSPADSTSVGAMSLTPASCSFLSRASSPPHAQTDRQASRLALSPAPLSRRRIAFHEDVCVVHIPSHTEYSRRIKSQYWTSPAEIYEMACRNLVEFEAEGYSWEAALEEEHLYWCPDTASFVHPAHIMMEDQDDGREGRREG